ILTSASPGPGSGIGTSRSSILFFVMNTAARMVAMARSFRLVWSAYSSPMPGARAREQLVVKSRVGYRDERLHTLAQALAEELRDAVLGDDIVHVVARRRYARAHR